LFNRNFGNVGNFGDFGNALASAEEHRIEDARE
jgi:hypothetical protein